MKKYATNTFKVYVFCYFAICNRFWYMWLDKLIAPQYNLYCIKNLTHCTFCDATATN